MAWTIELSKAARKQFDKLDRSVQVRLTDFIDNRLAIATDPRSLGHALTGNRLGDFSGAFE